MKKILFLIPVLFLFNSCKNTWDQDDKDLFYQSCMEDATTWAGSKEKAKTYCDCIMEKMMKKFPNENDALEHMDSVINDPDLQSCKKEVLGK